MEVQLLRYWQRDEKLEDTTCFSFVESQLFRYVGLSKNFAVLAKKLRLHEAKACGVFCGSMRRARSEEVEPPCG